jgi:hypothetical protein
MGKFGRNLARRDASTRNSGGGGVMQEKGACRILHVGLSSGSPENEADVAIYPRRLQIPGNPQPHIARFGLRSPAGQVV